jgi:hypothetical protein
MKFGRSSLRSIRYSIFIGVLAGSVFSGSGAFAADWDDLTAAINAGGEVTLDLNRIYVAPETIDSPTYFGSFSGTLNGSGATITGLTVPLFDTLSVASSVNNLSLEANSDVGVSGRGLLANESSGTIENVHGLGDVNGGGRNYVGGLVGTQGLEGGEIRDSSFIGNVASSSSTLVTGGLVGLTFSPIIDSTTSGNVSGGRYVGGLAGEVAGTEIINSHSTSNVTASADTAGGLLGSIESGGSVQNSSASIGAVLGTQSVGGLVGASYGSSILESFASGPVNGETNVGGLVGSSNGGYVSQSYSTSSVEGIESVGGLIGLADKTIYQGTIRGVQTTADDASYCEIVSFSCLSSEIESSYSTGAVTATGGVAGGLVGKLYSGAIFNSYSTSNVLGGTTVGGLVGRVYNYGQNSNLSYEGSPFENYYGLIENSYATGTINNGYKGANRIGGLVGILNGGKIINSYATAGGLGIDASDGCDHVGGLVGDGSGFEGAGSAGIIQDSYAHIEGNVSAGCGPVGGLAGSMGSGSVISNSFAYVGGNVSGNGNVGGLVGYTDGSITNSYSQVTGHVSSIEDYVGGLAGYAGGLVTNSYAFAGSVFGQGNVGGLIGNSIGTITNSYSRVTNSVIGTGNNVGGLAGYVVEEISNSFAFVGSGVSGVNSVGGLVGSMDGRIFNSYATSAVTGDTYIGGLVGYVMGNIDNSYSTGSVVGVDDVGGLAGHAWYESTISDSYSTGDVTGTDVRTNHNIGSLVGYLSGDVLRSYSTGVANGSGENTEGFIGASEDAYAWVNNSCEGSITGGNFRCTDESVTLDDSFVFGEIGTQAAVGDLGEKFATDTCYNNGNPYLVSLFDSYESSCGGGDEPPPPPTPPTRERIEREFREVVETRTPEKIEKLDGFKKEATVTKDSAITFVEPTEKIEVAKVKAVEVSATANVRVNAKAGEALQISLKSGSKEPVELWVKSPDGKWLLAGVITFDKDGKAILPPLKFKNVGNYSLVLSKPTADSAKGSAPLDQTGSLLVAVS